MKKEYDLMAQEPLAHLLSVLQYQCTQSRVRSQPLLLFHLPGIDPCLSLIRCHVTHHTRTCRSTPLHPFCVTSTSPASLQNWSHVLRVMVIMSSESAETKGSSCHASGRWWSSCPPSLQKQKGHHAMHIGNFRKVMVIMSSESAETKRSCSYAHGKHPERAATQSRGDAP
jgi:hypothetical protein